MSNFVVSEKSTNREIHFSLSQGTALVSCSGDLSSVQISSIKSKEVVAKNEFSLSHDELLKLATQILLLPEVREYFPHAALPETLSQSSSLSVGKQAEILNNYRKPYEANFGEQDQFGSSNIIGNLKRNRVPVSWGDDALVVSWKSAKDTGAQLFHVETNGPVSLHLLVDVMVGFISDNQTRIYFPHFSADYLRRWGEEAFDGAQLRAGIPEKLNSSVKLRPLEDEDKLPVSLSTLISAPTAQKSDSAPLESLTIPTRPEAESQPSISPISSEESERLRNLLQQIEQREAELATGREELATRQEQLNQKENELKLDSERQRHKLTKRTTELDQRQTRLDSQETEIKRRQTQLRPLASFAPESRDTKNRETNLLDREKKVTSAKEDLQRKEQELERRLSVVSRAEDVIREKQLKIDALKKEWDPKQAELNKQNQEIAQQRLELERKSKEFAQQSVDSISQNSELVAQREILDRREQTLSKLESSLLEREVQFQNDLKELTQAKERFASDTRASEQREKTLEQSSRELDQQQLRLKKVEETLATRERELTDARNTLEEDKEAFQLEVDQLSEDLAQRERTIEIKLAEIKAIEKQLGGLIAQHLIHAKSNA
jgi:hypothetical protein